MTIFIHITILQNYLAEKKVNDLLISNNGKNSNVISIQYLIKMTAKSF